MPLTIQRRKPIRKSSGRNRLTAQGRRRLELCHEQPCMVHGTTCPQMVNSALMNRLEAHHVDHNHKDPFRTVPICRLVHQHMRRLMPSRYQMEREIVRINRLYTEETGRKIG